MGRAVRAAAGRVGQLGVVIPNPPRRMRGSSSVECVANASHEERSLGGPNCVRLRDDKHFVIDLFRSRVGWMSRIYYIYILASASGVLFTGIANSVQRRVGQHRLKLIPGFTRKYNVTRLVYFELFGDVNMAIAREKEIKAWRRAKRVAPIQSMNPTWADLAADWFPAELPK